MASYDPDTTAGQVRLLISDVGGDDEASFIFEDEEILSFLAMRNGNLFLAAATALRSMAANEAMVSKVITFLDLKTDGAKVADALRALADTYEKQAEDDTMPEIAEMDTTIWADRALRGLAI